MDNLGLSFINSGSPIINVRTKGMLYQIFYYIKGLLVLALQIVEAIQAAKVDVILDSLF